MRGADSADFVNTVDAPTLCANVSSREFSRRAQVLAYGRTAYDGAHWEWAPHEYAKIWVSGMQEYFTNSRFRKAGGYHWILLLQDSCYFICPNYFTMFSSIKRLFHPQFSVDYLVYFNVEQHICNHVIWPWCTGLLNLVVREGTECEATFRRRPAIEYPKYPCW